MPPWEGFNGCCTPFTSNAITFGLGKLLNDVGADVLFALDVVVVTLDVDDDDDDGAPVFFASTAVAVAVAVAPLFFT